MAVKVAGEMRKAQGFEKSGQWAEAEKCYRAILASFPKNARARQGLAAVIQKVSTPSSDTLRTLSELYRSQRFTEMLALAESQSHSFPRSEQIWNLLGAASERLGDLKRAKHAFQKAVEINPARASSHGNLGAIFEHEGDFEQVLVCFSRALSLEPETPKYLLSRGNAHLALESSSEAIRDLEACVEVAPRNHKAQQLLADARRKSGMNERASSGLFETIKVLESDALQAPNNTAFQMQLADSYESLANAYCAEKKNDNAIAFYEKSLAIKPGNVSALANKLHTQTHQCDWRAYAEFTQYHSEIGIDDSGLQPWAFLSFEDNPAKQLKRSENYARQWSLDRPRYEPGQDRKKLRIGYFSSDLSDHATLVLLTGMLEHHDREAFEVFFYGLKAPRQSTLFSRLLAAVDHFVDISDLESERAVERARADNLDLAIDLKGYTEDARTDLFFAGMAPVQINYLGFPGTLGTAAFDYVLADATVIPKEARQHYNEAVLEMPHSYQPNDRVQLMAPTPTRSEFGLPETAVVLCCFNSNYKITPEEFDIWMRILRRNAETVLWLLDGGATVQANLRREAENRGVSGDRLHFARKIRRDKHLARHKVADLFLDTFNVNAHTTASDALYAGLPLVTRTGKQFAARVGASLCKAVGMDDLVATNSATYEAIIETLVQDAEKRQEVRDRLARNLQTAPLFQTEAYTRHLEAGYRAAWDNWRAGNAPTDIEIAAT